MTAAEHVERAAPAAPPRSVGAVIEAAGLPPRLGRIVRLVAGRARLFPRERAEVAREIAAHFRDALDAGTTETAIADAFGDPKVARRLVTRARRRGRPWPLQALALGVRGAALALLVALLVYAWLGARYLTARPALTLNFAREMNARTAAVPMDDRAWPVLLEAIVAFGPFGPEENEFMQTWPYLGPDGSPARAERGSMTEDERAEAWRASITWLEAHEEAVALARTVAARPALGAPIADALDPDLRDALLRTGREVDGAFEPNPSENPMLMAILLPHLPEIRRLGRMLAFDARVAALDDDGARLMADLEAVRGLARLANEPSTTIGQLVGLAIFAMHADTVRQVLREAPEALDDAGWRDVAHRTAAWEGGGDLRIDLASEHFMFEDMLQRMYTDDGHGDGRLTPQGFELLRSIRSDWGDAPAQSALDRAYRLTGPVFAELIAGRNEVRREHARLLALAESATGPLWATSPDAYEGELVRLMEDDVRAMRYAPIVVLTPAMGDLNRVVELTTMRRDATLVAIAMELHRRRHGAWPAALDELVPGFLPAVPPDRWDGAPLRYAVIDDRPVLWSVGRDRDDDGGREAMADDRINSRGAVGRRPRAADGDTLLWR